MAKVRIAKFTVFDFTGRRDVPSTRYARLDTIAIIGGEPVPGTEIMVDEQDLDDLGMTRTGYAPKSP